VPIKAPSGFKPVAAPKLHCPPAVPTGIEPALSPGRQPGVQPLDLGTMVVGGRIELPYADLQSAALPLDDPAKSPGVWSIGKVDVVSSGVVCEDQHARMAPGERFELPTTGFKGPCPTIGRSRNFRVGRI
jgi:hypothetical protein